MDVMGVPLLLGIKSLRRLKAVLDFDRCVAVFAAVDAGLAIHLKRSRSGHMLIDLKGDWLAEGTRLDNLPQQLSNLCFAEENLVEAAYVVQPESDESHADDCRPRSVPEHHDEPPSHAAHAGADECAVESAEPLECSHLSSVPKDGGPSASMKSLGAFLTLVACHGVSDIQPAGRMPSHSCEDRPRDQREGAWEEENGHCGPSRCAPHGRTRCTGSAFVMELTSQILRGRAPCLEAINMGVG